MLDLFEQGGRGNQELLLSNACMQISCTIPPHNQTHNNKQIREEIRKAISRIINTKKRNTTLNSELYFKH